MFINDIFKKKTVTESLRRGEYYTFQVFFDDGTDETLNFSSDDIDWDRVGVKRGKQVVDIERLGGIQGSQSDNPSKPNEYSDDRGLAQAQRAYDQKIPEGGFDIPEIPRAPTPKPPKEKNVAEESPYMDNKPSSVTAKQADQFGGAAKRAFKPEYYEPDTEPAPKSRNWDYNDPDVKPIVDKYLNDKILDKKPMTYKQDVQEDFDDLDRFMKDKYGPKPSGGSGVKRGTYGQPGRRRGRPTGATGGEGSGIPQAVDFDRPHSERSAGRRLPRFSDDYDAIRRSEVDEGSVQDRLHRRHQELRKKSGLPDPDYYQELKASYDIEDDRERVARQAEIKKKYRVSEDELEQQGREENRFPHFYHHKNNTIFTTPGGDRYDYDDPDQRQRWLDLYKKEFDMPTPHDGGWWRKGPDGDEAMVEQGVAEAGPFSYGAKKPRKGSVADLAAQKRKEQEKNKKPIEPKDQMVGTARVIKDVSEDFDDMSPHTSYVQSKRTVTSVNGKDHLSDRTASLSTDKSGNQRVRAVDGDKLTIDTNIPKGVNVKMIPQITNEDVERYLEEMRRAGYDIVTERATLCPECGGPAFEDQMLAEKQDACYHKVKSRYKVWPSAYASGALVRCRKKGAANWGNKSKK